MKFDNLCSRANCVRKVPVHVAGQYRNAPREVAGETGTGSTKYLFIYKTCLFNCLRDIVLQIGYNHLWVGNSGVPGYSTNLGDVFLTEQLCDNRSSVSS